MRPFVVHRRGQRGRRTARRGALQRGYVTIFPLTVNIRRLTKTDEQSAAAALPYCASEHYFTQRLALSLTALRGVFRTHMSRHAEIY